MTTKTTVHLTTQRAAHWLDRLALPPAFVVAALVFIVAGGISAIGRYTAVPAAAIPTPALPVYIIQTATPAPAVPTTPAVQVAAVDPPRYVVAFAAPDGAVLGAIPEPAASAIEARYGGDWVMIMWQGAPAWIRAAELGMQIPDLAPAPAPEVVYIAAQPAPAAPAAAPTYQVTNDPAPTLAPQQLVILDRQQWAEQARQR